MTSTDLCPLTSTLRQAPLVRIAVEPSRRNGLRKPSQLMVVKLFTVPSAAVGGVVGQQEPKPANPRQNGPMSADRLDQVGSLIG